jgi:Family of unknown function (DUF6090)
MRRAKEVAIARSGSFVIFICMEEELAKHTKKIYHAVKDPGHGFWEKLKDVAIEIFIIVFAVTLSIWFHNWSDHRHEQQEVKEFLGGLRSDLAHDLDSLQSNNKVLAETDSNTSILLVLIKTLAVDTINSKTLSYHLGVNLVSSHPNVGRYEGFKSSGKIGTIENDSLKQAILRYYQQTLPGVADMEVLVNSLQTKILDVELDNDNKQPGRELLKSFKMQTLLKILKENLEAQASVYGDARAQAETIISMIDRTP